MIVLTNEALQRELGTLDDTWRVEVIAKVQTLVKTIEANNFAAILEMVNAIGEIAEKRNHHPNLYLHDYKKLRIELSTHSEGGITDKDFLLAKEIDAL